MAPYDGKSILEWKDQVRKRTNRQNLSFWPFVSSFIHFIIID